MPAIQPRLPATVPANTSCKPNHSHAGSSRSLLRYLAARDTSLSSRRSHSRHAALRDSDAKSRAPHRARLQHHPPPVESRQLQTAPPSTLFHSQHSSTPRHLPGTDASSAFHDERNAPSSTSLLP